MTSGEILIVKAAVRERDGMACTECGLTNEQHIAEHGSSLEVHRVTPGSQYSTDPGVCVTLCKSCHGPKPRRPRGTLPKGESRMVRIPEEFAVVLEELAEEHFNTLAEQVKTAVREHLIRLDRMPPPPPRKPG